MVLSFCGPEFLSGKSREYYYEESRTAGRCVRPVRNSEPTPSSLRAGSWTCGHPRVVLESSIPEASASPLLCISQSQKARHLGTHLLWGNSMHTASGQPPIPPDRTLKPPLQSRSAAWACTARMQVRRCGHRVDAQLGGSAHNVVAVDGAGQRLCIYLFLRTLATSTLSDGAAGLEQRTGDEEAASSSQAKRERGQVGFAGDAGSTRRGRGWPCDFAASRGARVRGRPTEGGALPVWGAARGRNRRAERSRGRGRSGLPAGPQAEPAGLPPAQASMQLRRPGRACASSRSGSTR